MSELDLLFFFSSYSSVCESIYLQFDYFVRSFAQISITIQFTFSRLTLFNSNNSKMVSRKVSALALMAAAASAAPSDNLHVLQARQGAIIDGFHSGMTNFRQTVDTLTHQLTTNGGHAGADILGTVLTGIDAQIDNVGGTIATALAPFTGGLSLAVGNFLLGPFVQSVTNGAEVAIGNIVGGAADLVAAPVRMAFSHSLSNLAAQAKQYNIDTTRLEAANNKLRATFA